MTHPDVSRSRTGQAPPGGAAPRSPAPDGRAASAAGPQGTLAPPTPEQIAARAYQLWEAEGRPGDRAEQHWLAAEGELRGGAASREEHQRRQPSPEEDVELMKGELAGAAGRSGSRRKSRSNASGRKRR